MALTFYYHPLASYCHKVLIALYEKDVAFSGSVVDLADKNASASFLDLWPVGKMPVLRDEARDRVIPESSIIIEYLEQHYPGKLLLLPEGEDELLNARLWDRFFDLYVQTPVQKIVLDRLRPDNEKDVRGVAEAKAALRTAYDMIERQVSGKTWAIGEGFSVADCAAVPALFYADTLVPFTGTYPNTAAYFERLMDRPSVKRVITEAQPFFQFYPYKEAIPARFLGAVI